MDKTTPEASAPRRRRIPRWALIVATVVLLLAITGGTRHVYLAWKERRLIRVARVFLEQDRQKELRLALDTALSLNPRNLAAARLYAQAWLKDGSAKALPWLRRTVELAPGSLEDQLSLAEGASRFGQVQEAARVLKEIEPRARGRADYQDLAGRVAQQSGSGFAEAEARYAEAVRLAPGNETYRIHLAITRLAAPDNATRDGAREVLESIPTASPLRTTVLRALVVDAAKRGFGERATALAQELDRSSERTFSDRLILLEVLHLGKSADFLNRLAETEQLAEKKPEDVQALLTWMNGNKLSLLARDWALKLPAELTAATPIKMEIARTFLLFGDWKKLRFFLATEQWGELDFIRRAYLARCGRELESNRSPSKMAWSEAVNATSNKGDALFTLARLASEWKWDDEVADTLWQAVRKSNRSNEALSALGLFYFNQRNTDGLYQVYSILMDRNPGDPTIRNNFAIFCLLLDKDKAHALSVARELHEKDPASPVFTSTYAFALFCMGEKAKALEAMRNLKPEELRDPSTAAYYGAFLIAAGRSEEAQPYLELAKGANLLPEEAKLLNIPQTEAPPTDISSLLPQPMSGSLFPAAAPAATPSDSSSAP
ncbi:MAG: hypothetical protein ACFUZC_09785 [Chthoniobacteraceae bacterium]